MIAALPIEAGEQADPMLAAIPCWKGPLDDAAGADERPRWAMGT